MPLRRDAGSSSKAPGAPSSTIEPSASTMSRLNKCRNGNAVWEIAISPLPARQAGQAAPLLGEVEGVPTQCLAARRPTIRHRQLPYSTRRAWPALSSRVPKDVELPSMHCPDA
eukprot:scaffold49701_cov33-Tisochrysis_lutea.AAC.4